MVLLCHHAHIIWTRIINLFPHYFIPPLSIQLYILFAEDILKIIIIIIIL